MLTRRVLVLLGLIVLTHVVLAWFMRVPAIGWGEDDAVYSLLGRGLGAGTYREYWIVDSPIHARYPPGLPALLAASNAVFGERLDAQLALMNLFSAASLLLLFDATRRRLGQETALWATVLLALNPIALGEGGRIMAEAPFRMLLLLTLWAASVRDDGRHAALAVASRSWADSRSTACS